MHLPMKLPMHRPLRAALLLLLWSVIAACGDTSPATKPAATPAAKRVAVVPKGTTHEFWKSVQAGAMLGQDDAAGAIAVTYRGPEKEDDREQQVSLVQNLVSARYDAIVLAPLDSKALLAPVRQARQAGIEVVIMDSALEGEPGVDFASFVATDSEAGGRLAGERMAALLPKGGKVLLLRYLEGSASTAAREKGFVDAIAKAPGVTLVDPRRYAGATRATAQDAAENLLAANGDIAGVFCPNESSTFGMMLALRSRALLGKVAFVGFDSSAELVDALRAGEIAALVVQDPIKMGRLAVKAAADALAGRPVERRVDTGVAVVTKDNLAEPDIARLVNPKGR
ncbi:MAG: substrate-binding domain-containing protein [Phycisphaerae bacterium]